MQRVELEVKPRDLGQKDVKRNLNQLRKEGWVPGVLYGHGEPTPIAIDLKHFKKAIQTKAGINALFTVKVGKEAALGVIKEIQRDLLKHHPIHVDIQRINLKEKLEMNVSVHVVGEAPGVKNSGGILETIQREIRVRCLPDDIPATIDVDVSKLELGHGIKVQDLIPPKGVEFVTPGDHIVVNVVAPKVEEVAAPAAAAVEAAAQPEVITKGKKEEGAEGAAAGTAPAAQAAPEKGDKEKEKKK